MSDFKDMSVDGRLSTPIDANRTIGGRGDFDFRAKAVELSIMYHKGRGVGDIVSIVNNAEVLYDYLLSGKVPEAEKTGSAFKSGSRP